MAASVMADQPCARSSKQHATAVATLVVWCWPTRAICTGPKECQPVPQLRPPALLAELRLLVGGRRVGALLLALLGRPSPASALLLASPKLMVSFPWAGAPLSLVSVAAPAAPPPCRRLLYRSTMLPLSSVLLGWSTSEWPKDSTCTCSQHGKHTGAYAALHLGLLPTLLPRALHRKAGIAQSSGLNLASCTSTGRLLWTLIGWAAMQYLDPPPTHLLLCVYQMAGQGGGCLLQRLHRPRMALVRHHHRPAMLHDARLGSCNTLYRAAQGLNVFMACRGVWARRRHTQLWPASGALHLP